MWLTGLWAELSKRNPGSWSDFLRDPLLLKAELRLKQHLQKAQTTQQGRFGKLSGREAGLSSHISHRLQGTSLPRAPALSSVQLGVQTRPVVFQLVPENSRGTRGTGDILQGEGGRRGNSKPALLSDSINQSSQVLYKIYPLMKGFHCKRKFKTSCSRGFLLPAILCFYQLSSFIQQFNKHLLTVWMLTGKPSPCF